MASEYVGSGWPSIPGMRNGILSEDRQVTLEKGIIWAEEVMYGAWSETKYIGAGREVKGESKGCNLGLWNQDMG